MTSTATAQQHKKQEQLIVKMQMDQQLYREVAAVVFAIAIEAAARAAAAEQLGSRQQ